MTALWIALGGAIGSAGRYGVTVAMARAFGETFPWGTLTVNVLGSLLIGVFAALAGPDGRLMLSPTAREFVMIGLFGGFTTFSSFSLQTLAMAQDGAWLGAALNVVGSVVLCLAGVWAGYTLATALSR